MERSHKNGRSSWLNFGVVSGVSILYFILFPFLHQWMGDSAAALSAIPVAAAGWYLGLTWGIASSLAGLLVNAVLFATFSNDSNLWQIFPPGGAVLLFVGGIAGYLHDVWQNRNTVEIELRGRERFLTKLNDIASGLLVVDDLQTALKKLAIDLTDLFESDACYINRWDAIQKQTVPVAATIQLSQPYEEIKFEPGEVNLGASVLDSGHSIAIDDVAASPLVSRQIQAIVPTKSILGIPLIFGERKIGAALIAYNSPRQFTADDLRHAEQAGNHLALALWDIQQETELRRRLRESNTLASIAQALSETERVSLDNVLQLIVDSAKELIPATEQAVIHLLDEEQQVLVPRAVNGFDAPDDGKMNMRLGKGVAGQVIADGNPVNIANVETDPRFLRQASLPRFRSLMVAPVQSGKMRLGTISVQSSHPNAFSAEEMQLLDSLGMQASIAIENAHLLETTRQGLKEVNALYRITQGLAASLDTEKLMKDVVDLLQQTLGYFYAQIFVLEAETGDLRLEQGSGELGARLKAQGHRLKPGEGIVGHAAETGKPFVTNNVQSVVFYVVHPSMPNIQSELAVPIMLDNRTLGVLDVRSVPPMRLTERDLQLVGAAADQLAVALHKASLYSDLQISLAQEKAVRSQLVQSERLALVGRLLASVSHELNNPLQAIQNALFLLKEDASLTTQGRQDLQIIISEAERMGGLIERLRMSYRPTQLEDFQAVQINTIVEDVYALMSTHLRHKEIAFEFHPDPDLPAVFGLPDQLRQVTLNLFINAVEAMSSGGRLTVATETQNQEYVVLSVSDTGAGINPSILPNIFDAFVTNKEGGTGLGLTITYDIIHRHNGRIEAANNPDLGATFTAWLPIFQEETP
jgi:signal transduction histidine kinase